MKIGIFAGMERAFPDTLIAKLSNEKLGGEKVRAELVQMGAFRENRGRDYDIIIDRISHEIYLYRVYCKTAVLAGTYVINNPFWFSADDKFFGTALAKRLNIPVPKTLLIPSKAYPSTLTDRSFRNLQYPLDWDAIFHEIGFPAFFKQHMGGGWANVYKVHNREEFFQVYDQTGELLMMLQEAIEFEEFVRCIIIGKRNVLPIKYDPANRRYETNEKFISPSLQEKIVGYASEITTALGYDMNSAEFAIRDGIPYAIDFTNPGPDFDPSSITPKFFDWVIHRFMEFLKELIETLPQQQPPLNWRSLIETRR